MSLTALADVSTPPQRDAQVRSAATVTIIMSNYNQAAYLPASLDGIVNQTRPADKIYVIDDGSTDESVEIIRSYEARTPNLRMIRNVRNLGLQKSIARTLPLVTTDYLVWAASDDVLLPDFLERSMALLARYPDAGLCFSELTVLKDETGEIQPFAQEPSVAHVFNLSDLPEYMPPAAVRARMKRCYFPVSGNTVVVKRTALADCGDFFSDLQWHSDHFAFNIIPLRHGACVVRDTLGYIRERGDSYSKSGMRDPAAQQQVLSSMLDIIGRPDFDDIRRAFEAAPSYYSVWGTSIVRQMARRPGFWRTMVRYVRRQVREYRLGHQLGFWQTNMRLAKFVLRRLKIFGGLGSMFRRGTRAALQELESIRTERDQLIAERERLGRAVHETAQQRDENGRTITQLEQQLLTQESTIGETRSELDRANARSAELADELQKTRTELEARIERTSRKVEAIAAELKTAQDERDALATAMEQVVTDRDRIARVVHATAIQRDTYAEEIRELREQLQPEEADETSPDGEAIHSTLITTMPKSGTYYISRLFSEGLGVKSLMISNQYFPQDTIYQPRLRQFVKGNYVSQDHFPGSEINVSLLERLVRRIVVHVRDPRQATLSYVHFLDNDQFRANEPETLKFVYPPLPDNFYELPLSQRLDWGIDCWLPALVGWVDEWIAIQESGRLDVKFTSFESMKSDEGAFVADILEFFDIDKERYNMPTIDLQDGINFRKGEIDEWRSVFSEQQIEAADKAIPSHLAERFGWE